MRLRLLLSFALVIFVALGSVLLVINLSAEQQVRRYLGRSALAGVEALVDELESYYEESPSWEGVSAIFEAEQTTSTTSTALPDPTPLSESTNPLQPIPTQNAQTPYMPGAGEGKGPAENAGKGQGQGELHPTPTPFKSAATPLPSQTVIGSETVEGSTNGVVTLSAPGQGMGQGRKGHLLTDNAGIILYSSDEADIGQPVTKELLDESIAIEDDGETVAYLIPAGGVPRLPESYETQLIKKIQQATLIAAIISGILAILMALLLSRMILKPVEALSQAADQLSKGNLTQRVTLKGKNELAELGKTFNQMADALQLAEQQRRTMTADIAHELRTPLAVQRANLEALQDGIYPLNITALAPIIEQNRLLTRLVDDLRILALVDSGELSLNIRPFDLSNLSATTISQFESMLGYSNIQTSQTYQPGLSRVIADPERVAQILQNLLQNAYRYSSPDTTIYINTTQIGTMASLTIRDQGPGIPADSLEKIFERFYRVAKGRERDKGGTGLGLPIARKLAEAQGGSLTAANYPEGGAVFTLLLPLENHVHPEVSSHG
jgi:signal transduction histidine kinase